MLKRLDWIAAVLTFTGNFILIGERSWVSFVVFFLANLFWIIHWYRLKQTAPMLLSSAFLFQNVWGIFSWR